MARIILIETSTALCSVALAEDGVCTHYKASPEPRAHAAMTAPFVKDILDEAGLKVSDCDAVCVSKGPGSYTGLRVGSSTAKGLCFGAGIPLIAVGTLDVLAAQAMASTGPEPAAEIAENLSERPRSVFRSNPAASPAPAISAIVPMIDARRMEVYTTVFSPEGKQLTPTVSSIITPESFAAELAAGPILFVGDGAFKCRPVLTSPNALFPEDTPGPFAGCPRASSMAALAEAAYQDGRFEDTAYFEPFYLKEFIATLPRKTLW